MKSSIIISLAAASMIFAASQVLAKSPNLTADKANEQHSSKVVTQSTNHIAKAEKVTKSKKVEAIKNETDKDVAKKEAKAVKKHVKKHMKKEKADKAS